MAVLRNGAFSASSHFTSKAYTEAFEQEQISSGLNLWRRKVAEAERSVREEVEKLNIGLQMLEHFERRVLQINTQTDAALS